MSEDKTNERFSWRLMRETSPGVFAPTGDYFLGRAEPLAAYLQEVQEETGACHAAELAPDGP